MMAAHVWKGDWVTHTFMQLFGKCCNQWAETDRLLQEGTMMAGGSTQINLDLAVKLHVGI